MSTSDCQESENTPHTKKYNTIYKLLIDGYNVNASDMSGNIPMHYLAQSGNRECGELLLYHHSLLGVKNKNGNTPLHIAVGANNIVFAEFLIDNLVDINAQNKDGQTPLHLAVMANNIEMVELLLR
jgi:ankyrin repeat protein